MMTQQRLARSTSDKVIAGVCGGLGHYFGVDPVIMRLVMVGLVFMGGLGLLIYPIFWLVMPAQPTAAATRWSPEAEGGAFSVEAGAQRPALAGNRALGAILLGIGLLLLASYFGSTQLMLTLLLLGAGIYLLRRRPA